MESGDASGQVAPRAGRGRPGLSPGQRGQIETSAWVLDPKTGRHRRKRTSGDSRRAVTHWTAEAYVGTDDGKRRVQARGKNAATATAALEAKLVPQQRDLLAEALAGERPTERLSNRSTLGEVLDAWLADPAVRESKSTGTLVRYAHAVERSIKGRELQQGGKKTTLGAQRIDRVTPKALEAFIADLTPAVGRTCRGILRQALTYAVHHGADAPSRNGASKLSVEIKSPRVKPKPTVAITKAKAQDIVATLQADEQASATDLPALFQLLAGTGARISEVLALTYDQLDLDAPVPLVHINATVNALGQRQPFPKTRAGVRRLALPPDVADMLRERRRTATGSLVFPSSRRRNAGRVETPYWASNITGVIRKHLDRLGYEQITARSFRRMVATELDKAGLTARQIADQLGHENPSVTLDTYQAREGIGPIAVASVLASAREVSQLSVT